MNREVARSFISAVSGFSLLALLLMGITLYLGTRPPELASRIVPIIPTAVHAERFDAEIDSFEQQTLHPEPGEFVTVSITQEEATSKLDEMIRRVDSPIRVRDIVVNFVKGKIVAVGRISLSVDVAIGLVARIEIDEHGKPQLAIEEIDIGRGAQLPGGIAEQVAAMVPSMEEMTDYLKKFPVTLKSVVIDQGRLTITGIVTSSQLKSIGMADKPAVPA